MSPEQLKVLQRLSQLFEEGIAGPSQIKELSTLLAAINQSQGKNELFPHTALAHSRTNTAKL
jgi:hypothetical protein